MAPRPLSIALIIPVLNEGGRISGSLSALRARIAAESADAEIIVVDGGSCDDSAERARGLGVRLVVSLSGRARQMRAGVRVSAADVLVFMHIDTELPEGYFGQLRKALNSGALWGFSRVRFDDSSLWARAIAAMMNLRSGLSGICTGDQVMYMRRSVYEAAGGMPDLPLMEDIRLAGRLNALASPRRLADPVRTSARRWRRRGVARTIALMWWLRLAHYLGVAPARLADWYR